MLSAAQITTIRADIAANPDLNAKPNNSDGSSAIAALYNADAVADFFVWATAVPVKDVFDAIIWANLTPTDAPDGTLGWQNRSLACQGKQFNLQTLLMGQSTINGAKLNVRAGLQDALLAVPSGVGGASQAAGWVQVRTVLARKASRIEKLLATVTGGNGSSAQTAAVMTFEGPVSYQDIDVARAN